MSDELISAKWDDKNLRVKLNRSQKGVRPIATGRMKETGGEIVKVMRANLARHPGKGGGKLEASIGSRLDDRRGLQTLTVAPGVEDESVTAPFFMTIEKGRRPGSKRPPLAAMQPWFESHGIPEDAWFPIMKKIGESGLAGQPFPYIEPTRPVAATLMRTCAESVVSDVAKLIGS